MIHHFTVDVEEYFHATPLEAWLPRDRWDGLERRSPRLVARLLELLDRRGVKGTFFVLGWLAEREPDVVRAIAAAGHEIASHGWAHRVVHGMQPKDFRTTVRRSKELLEELSGRPVVGYRAPSFSILPGTEWALGILEEEGYEYDSSLFPTSVHPSYGYPDAPRVPHVLDQARGTNGTLVEVPPSTCRLAGLELPGAGGAYFRILPYALTRRTLRQAEARGAPGTFYIHPWEVDEHPPSLPAPWRVRARLQTGTGRTGARLERLLRDFEFGPMGDTVAGLRLAV